MLSPRTRFSIAAAVVGVSILGLVGWSLSGATTYYKTPAELAAAPTNVGDRIRVAGTVIEGSVLGEGGTTRFLITDGEADVEVATDAVLPDTFAPGIEVVAEGAMTDQGIFSASTILVKCPSKFKAANRR